MSIVLSVAVSISRGRARLVGAAVVVALFPAACSSSATTKLSSSATTHAAETSTTQAIEASTTGAIETSAASTTTEPATSAPGGNGIDPNAPEVVEPGDIPDNQVFVTFPAADGTYSIKVPEGWARTDAGGIVTFTDKYNSIAVTALPSALPPSIDSVRATGLQDVAADASFHLLDVQPVVRPAGTGVLATYEIGSAPNAVTGKKALLAVERYYFAHNGTTVVLTLSGAKGADNVDPWRVVSDSLTWLK